MKLKNIQRTTVIRLDKEDMTYFTKEGYLIDHPIVTRTGIFEYHNPDGSVRKEFRPPEEVFDEESLKSYQGKPVIITHDAEMVNKDNVSDEEIGTILEPGYRDGESVRAKIVIHDTDSMKDCGLRELSLGYSLEMDETPGEYNGEHYDAIQRNIRINHLALVAEARAGETARLNIDSKDKSKQEAQKEGGTEMKRHDGDNLTPEEIKAQEEALEAQQKEQSADEDEPILEPEENSDEDEPTTEEKIQEVRDRRDRRDSDDDPTDLEAATEVIKEQEEDINTLLDCIDKMEAEKDMQKDCEEANKDSDDENADDDNEEKKEETVNADSIDKIVKERIKVLRVADKLHMDGLEDLSVIGMKKAIIRKVNPKVRLDGKSKGYINAAYDFIVENVIGKKGVNYQRQQMAGMGMHMDSAPKKPVMTGAMAARERMIKRHEEGGNE